MKEIELLDNILLDNNVVERFNNEWANNASFKDWLNNILPEIEDCKNQQQRNPWHKYNVLDHILHSVQAINSQTKDMPLHVRRRLAYVMFLHDIGKPKHHIERIKDGEIIDSFFNHNIGSEQIAKRVLPTFNFDTNEITIISKLVFKHDIFMFIKDFATQNPYWKRLTDEVIKDEIADLNSIGNGAELLRQLIMVGRSDNLAQNEKMTADSLKMLDKMVLMLERISPTIELNN